MNTEEILSRPDAQVAVDAVTFKINQYSAVSFTDCKMLLGDERFAMLLSDPVRRLGPTDSTVYPWNLVDYLSNKNPRGNAK